MWPRRLLRGARRRLLIRPGSLRSCFGLLLALVLATGAAGCTFATNFARPIVEPPPDAPIDAGPDGEVLDAQPLDAEPLDAETDG